MTRYVIILCDGMADRPVDILNGRTPLEAADTPNMDRIAARGQVGRIRTLYEELPKGSDVANLSILGYDPHRYYTGRSPIEALGLGIPLNADDTVFRMNLVTLSEDEPFAQKTMLDHSSDKITTEEATELVEALADQLGTEVERFYTGVSYRHIFVLSHTAFDGTLTPPHDILGQAIASYLPTGGRSEAFIRMMERSYEILSAHPVNRSRVARGLRPANCLWLWGDGKKPAYESFREKTGIERARMITAVPLLEGLAVGMGLEHPKIPGATGEYDTNYAGKAASAIEALQNGYAFVFIHIEAPDECGHDGDALLKQKSIEQIDRHIVGPVYDALESLNEPYRLVITPDHATPVSVRTHTSEMIPFLLCDSRKHTAGACFTEKSAQTAELVIEDGYTLLGRLMQESAD